MIPRKYTVIYNNRWQVGSHTQCLTVMKRVETSCEDKDLGVEIEKIVGTSDIQFIFEGWPKMVGEE